jgi:hypothetical protein
MEKEACASTSELVPPMHAALHREAEDADARRTRPSAVRRARSALSDQRQPISGRHARRSAPNGDGGDRRPPKAEWPPGHAASHPAPPRADGQGHDAVPGIQDSLTLSQGGRPPPPSLRAARVVLVTRSDGGAAGKEGLGVVAARVCFSP